MYVHISISGTAEELAELDPEGATMKALTLDFIPDDAHVYLSINQTQSFERPKPMDPETS